MNKSIYIQVSKKLDISEQKQMFAEDLKKGLMQYPKKVPSKYLYDDKGSELFVQIMGLGEYYLTHKEYTILDNFSADIIETIQATFSKENNSLELVELGCGNGHKAKVLLSQLEKKDIGYKVYFIDISKKALDYIYTLLSKKLFFLDCLLVESDYLHGIEYVQKISQKSKLFLFLGSSLGNMLFDEAIQFLKLVRSFMNKGDYFLLGLDLKKDIKVLEKAYNDSKNITQEFNLNLLDRINREFSGNFDRRNFIHFPCYNPIVGAMESYLISNKEHSVQLKDINLDIKFDIYEAIYIEVSNKFSIQEVETLAKQTGFKVLKHFTDKDQYFLNTLWAME